MEEMEHKLPEILPILPVRDSVIFPRMVVPLMIRDEEYVKLVDEVLQKDKLLVVSMIKDPEKTERPPEVFRVGLQGSNY